MVVVNRYEDLGVLTLSASAMETPDQFEAGIADIVRVIAEEVEWGNSIAIDVRVARDPTCLGIQEAVVQAIRGLVQSYTMESGTRRPPINVVLSCEAQDLDRHATWRYLAGPEGRLPRGATFDLAGVGR